ncbi:MAG: hypothetical protein LBI99_01815 [Propionibacteriaceae bacterium]|nr:hypothetical protein [Propionibacteriaceae bacterium]
MSERAFEFPGPVRVADAICTFDKNGFPAKMLGKSASLRDCGWTRNFPYINGLTWSSDVKRLLRRHATYHRPPTDGVRLEHRPTPNALSITGQRGKSISQWVDSFGA